MLFCRFCFSVGFAFLLGWILASWCLLPWILGAIAEATNALEKSSDFIYALSPIYGLVNTADAMGDEWAGQAVAPITAATIASVVFAAVIGLAALSNAASLRADVIKNIDQTITKTG